MTTATVDATTIDFAATNAFGDSILYDGRCPNPDCAEQYTLDTCGCLPDHPVAGSGPGRPHCDGSGQPGLEPHRARYFFLEGVRWL